VKPFEYLGDRLFLAGCCLYALNRWILKPHVHSAFLHDHFNDVLLIPCALPVVLWFQRLGKLRSHDAAPTAGEICFHLVVWSLLFEWLRPHLIRHAVGDPWDVVAYIGGGLLAGLWWNRQRLFSPVAADGL